MKNEVNRAAKAKTTDKDLRFLSSCENEDLRILCDILTHDRLGNIRVTPHNLPKVYTAFLKLTSGLSDIQGNPYQLVEQGRKYNEMKNASFLDRVQQACREMFFSHPQNCQRAYEIDRWKSSAAYRNLTKALFPDPNCTNRPPALTPSKRESPTQD